MQQIIYPNQAYGIFRRGLDFFYQKKATSPDTAITMTDADWLYALGETTQKRQGILKSLPYIKMTDDNKYWIDMVAYEKYLDDIRQRGNRIGFTIIGFTVILLLVSLLLSLQ